MFRPLRALVALVPALALAAPFAATTTGAAPVPTVAFSVTSSADAPVTPAEAVTDCVSGSHDCTLRAALVAAAQRPVWEPVVIALDRRTVLLDGSPLVVARGAVTIAGSSSSTSIVSGGGVANVVTVDQGATVRLLNLTLTDGATKSVGGALDNFGTTTLVHTIVSDSRAHSGGGLYNAATGSLHVEGSLVADNETTTDPTSSIGGDGGGIANLGVLTLTSTTVRDDAAAAGADGAAGGNGGGLFSTGSVTAVGVTFTSDAAGAGGDGGDGQGGPGGDGGAIDVSAGEAWLSNCDVDDSNAGDGGPGATLGIAGDGGGIANEATVSLTGGVVNGDRGGVGSRDGSGGGVASSGWLRVDDVSFDDDESSATSTALSTPGDGGAIASTGYLELSNSTVMDCSVASALSGAISGGDGGGVAVLGGDASLSGDTFADDLAGNGGAATVAGGSGGVGGSGGGLFADATVSVVNSTFTLDGAGTGGADDAPATGVGDAGVGGALAVADGATAVSYATIASNDGGVAVLGGTLSLTGTIVTNNQVNCVGAINDLGYNLDNTDECGFALATDLHDTDPALGPLANNGGDTATLAPSATSPVLEAGATVAEGCPTTDQRGDVRPAAGSAGRCDIGAVEEPPAT